MAHSRLKKLRRTLGGETTLEGAIDAMGKEREEQVLEQLAQFVDQVVVIVVKLRDVVERFAADLYDELEESARELDELESHADDTKEAILDRLSLGTVFPMHRADLARLVGSMDSIANLAAGAADRIVMRRFSLPAAMNEQLVMMAQVDVEAVQGLRDAVVAMETDLREAIRLAGVVDKIESQADDTFAELYRSMFDMDTDFKTFHQLKAIIERLESIADRCSQNAESIRHMALEYLENE
jgi:predicted phosphate transport protein (TIGR00153 family)